jgi:microcystin-dependent protein
MPDTFTPNYNMTKPEVGGSPDTWGTKTNGNWDIIDTKIKEAVDAALAAQNTADAAFPVSAIIMSGANAITGFLPCNGAPVSRTTYADLFAAIGVTFGPGDNINTFNVPDFRGYFPRGADQGRGVDPARVLGSNQANQLESHVHQVTGDVGDDTPDHVHLVSGSTAAAGTHTHTYTDEGASDTSTQGGGFSAKTGSANKNTGSAGSHSHTISFWSGGASARHHHPIDIASAATGVGTETRPVNLAVNFFIKF